MGVRAHSDEGWHVALCPELDIASQRRSVEEARRNLIEAIELFFQAASPSEIQERIHSHPLGDLCGSGGCPRCPGCGDYLQDWQSYPPYNLAKPWCPCRLGAGEAAPRPLQPGKPASPCPFGGTDWPPPA